MDRRTASSFALVVLCALALAPAARAQRVVSLDARSFGRERSAKARAGGWLPVWVDYQYKGPTTSGHVELAFADAPAARWAVPVAFADGARVRVLVYAYVGEEGRATLVVRIAGADGVTLRGGVHRLEVVAHPAGTRRVLAMGATELAGVIDEPRFERLLGRGGISVVATGADQPLPDRPEGYEPFSAVVLARYPLAEQPAAAQAALATWVARGGALLWSADAAAPLASAGRVVDALLPIVRPRELSLPDLAALDVLVRPALEPLDGEPAPAPFRVAAGELREGAIQLAGHGGRTLVAARPHGVGSVAYAGLDLTRPPLAAWPLRERLLLAVWGEHAGVRTPEQLAAPMAGFLRPRWPRTLIATIVATGILHALGLVFVVAFVRRRIPRWRDALWPVPVALAVGAIVAPVAILGTLSLQSRWRSVAVSFQRAGDASSHDRVYCLPATPTAATPSAAFPAPLLPTQVGLDQATDVAIDSRVVQGERAVLEDASFLLGSGRPLAVALDRDRAPITGGAGLVDQPDTGLAIAGWIKGVDLGRVRTAAFLWADRAGVCDHWSAHDDGWRHAPVVLDRGHLDAIKELLGPWVASRHLSRLASSVALDRPRDPHSRGCELVWIEEGPPPFRPVAPWFADRHLELRVLRLPLTIGATLRIETVIDHEREAHAWRSFRGSGSGSGSGPVAGDPPVPANAMAQLECRFRPALRGADLRRGMVSLQITCDVTAPPDAWTRKAVVLEVARPGGGWLEVLPGQALPHAVVQAAVDMGELVCRLRPTDPTGWFCAQSLDLELELQAPR